MKPLLLFKDHNFDLSQQLPWNCEALVHDLELKILFNTMSAGDDFIYDVVQKVILSAPGNTADIVQYRQDILKDCLSNVSVVKDIYKLSMSIIEKRKNSWLGIFTSRPSSILWDSINMMRLCVDILKQLRKTAEEHSATFSSTGFTTFFNMLRHDLPDEYFKEIEDRLEELKFKDGILMSAQLGEGNKASHYVLHKPELKKTTWWQRFFNTKPENYYFDIHPRDDSGIRMLTQLKDEGINVVANVLAQSNDHILSFFKQLQIELAFYIGCLNLQTQVVNIGASYCFPDMVDATDKKVYNVDELFDISLALSMKRKIVGNELHATDKNLILITGANQGGKSTFLRSIGVAQLMMQAGMFVAAKSFYASLCTQIFTHFKREEDNKMKSGKFDEELSRMNDIINHLKPHSLLLFNESFAATNEREGSEIAIQIVSALMEKGLTIFFVTHLFNLANHFYTTANEQTVFLIAERQNDGIRTFKLKEGAPLQTSYGIDLYNKIFDDQIIESHKYQEQ